MKARACLKKGMLTAAVQIESMKGSAGIVHGWWKVNACWQHGQWMQTMQSMMKCRQKYNRIRRCAKQQIKKQGDGDGQHGAIQIVRLHYSAEIK